jgi:hypothetical protein
MFVSYVSVSLEERATTKSAVVNRPYYTPPPLPPLPPYPSGELPTFSSSTQRPLILEISSELPKSLENTEVPRIHYKPIQPPWIQDGLKEHLSSTTELNKRIPIPTDPTPLILQPPTAVYIPKKPSIIPQIDKASIRLTTVKPVTTSIAPHITLSPLTISERLNPIVTELNKTTVTKPVKTQSTASTASKMLTVAIHSNSSLISTTLLEPQQTTTTYKTTLISQNYSKVIEVTRKPVVMSVPPVTELKQTARTSAPTVLPLSFYQSTTIPSETQEITEQLKYSEPITRPPWMTVTRGKQIRMIYLNKHTHTRTHTHTHTHH